MGHIQYNYLQTYNKGSYQRATGSVNLKGHDLRVKEGCGLPDVADATSSSDSVDVFVDGLGQIVVDDVLHAADVETSGGHVGGHNYVHAAGTEVCQSSLALPLEPVAVN